MPATAGLPNRKLGIAWALNPSWLWQRPALPQASLPERQNQLALSLHACPAGLGFAPIERLSKASGMY